MNYLKISLGIIAALAASRFIPHPPNFTSLLALSFYVPALLGARYIPVLLIGFVFTDLIIGFPTETTSDFNLTKKLFTELDFDYSFSFIYSKRPGTPAAYLKDETTDEEKLERLHEIQSFNIKQGAYHTNKMIENQ